MVFKDHVVPSPFYRGWRPDDDAGILSKPFYLPGKGKIRLFPHAFELVFVAVEEVADMEDFFIGVTGFNAVMAEYFSEKIEGNDLFANRLPELDGFIDKGRRFQPDYRASNYTDLLGH